MKPLNRITSALSKVAAKAGAKGAEKAGAVVSKGAAVVSSLPAWKWGAIVLVIVVIITGIGGVTAGVSGVAGTLAGPASCSGGSGSQLISEAEKSGITLSEDQKTAANNQQGKSCGGVGYNGDTYPVTPGRVTAFFGERAALRNYDPHSGTDIAGACGDPIFAFAGGTVTVAIMGTEGKSTSGNYVFPMGRITIEHTPEFSTSYVHTKGSTTTVKVGDIVSAGDQIAAQWSNGRSTGCHLHFEAYSNGKQVDGLSYLEGAGYPYSDDYYYGISEFQPKPVPGGGGDVTSSAPPGSAQAIAAAMMSEYGWGQEQFSNCLVPLWTRESGWRTNALNPAFAPSKPPTPENQAYGIPQSGPGSKMASAGADWKTNPKTQIKWGLDYIKGI
jgi:murein DD-endopeptidase MepM/ murein hydrolase activator NlpD